MKPKTLTLTFTLEHWRIITVALVKAKRSAFIQPEKATTAHELATFIARETGKADGE